MTLLVSLFARSRNLLFDVFLPRKIIVTLGIITINPLKVPVKKLSLEKTFTTHELLRKWLLTHLAPILQNGQTHSNNCRQFADDLFERV